MAVKFFDKGEHPTGFYGFKAYDQTRHRYYAVQRYGIEQARLQALAQSNNFEYYHNTRGDKPGLIVDGFYCDIIDNKDAVFVVDIPGLLFKKQIIKIKNKGYDFAWSAACLEFCRVNVCDRDHFKWLLEQIPSKDVFNAVAYRKRLKRVFISD